MRLKWKLVLSAIVLLAALLLSHAVSAQTVDGEGVEEDALDLEEICFASPERLQTVFVETDGFDDELDESNPK